MLPSLAPTLSSPVHIRGRGRNYSRARGAVEACLRVAYRGGWPARVWGALPGRCRVRVVRVAMPLRPAGAAPLRLGFASDLHIGPTTPPALLDAAFDTLARERLDVLLLGGDYVFLDADAAVGARLAALVARVPARRKLAVLGNHDLWTDHRVLERALVGAGVEMVVNGSALVDGASGGVAVIGLDDPWTGEPDAAVAVRALPEVAAAVVLCHAPDAVPEAAAMVRALPGAPGALYVCGHTHGGHVAAPWGPLVVPGRLGKQFASGLHRHPPLEVLVSRGLGGIEVPVRTWAAPEVAVIDLVAQSAPRPRA